VKPDRISALKCSYRSGESLPLALLLGLNRRCAAAENEGRPIVGPGLPVFCDGDGRFLSDDCLRMPAA
jgi:hypothetical protein